MHSGERVAIQAQLSVVGLGRDDVHDVQLLHLGAPDDCTDCGQGIHRTISAVRISPDQLEEGSGPAAY
ncbi:hypothetical protein D3C76_1587260 [compost metagenome]